MQIVGLGHQGLSKGAQGQLIRCCSGNAAVLSDCKMLMVGLGHQGLTGGGWCCPRPGRVPH